jgi:hypothetical protein
VGGVAATGRFLVTAVKMRRCQSWLAFGCRYQARIVRATFIH